MLKVRGVVRDCEAVEQAVAQKQPTKALLERLESSLEALQRELREGLAALSAPTEPCPARTSRSGALAHHQLESQILLFGGHLLAIEQRQQRLAAPRPTAARGYGSRSTAAPCAPMPAGR